MTSVDFPTPLAPRNAQRAPAVRERAEVVDPRAGAAAGDEDGHAEGDLDQLAPRRLGVVDEVGLGEHDGRLGAAVEGEHELAFETALVRRRPERVGEEHDVDVRGQRVGHGAGALERRPPDERRPAGQDVLDALDRRPTARPSRRPRRRLRCCARASGLGPSDRTRSTRAPAPIEPGDPARRARRADGRPTAAANAVVPPERSQVGTVAIRHFLKLTVTDVAPDLGGNPP